MTQVITLDSLVGKRILGRISHKRYGDSYKYVEEIVVLEISPTGSFVKVKNERGTTFWLAVGDLSLVKELKQIARPPKKGADPATGPLSPPIAPIKPLKLVGQVFCGKCQARLMVESLGEVTCWLCNQRQTLSLLIDPIPDNPAADGQ